MRDGCPFCDYDGPSPIFAEANVAIRHGYAFEPYFVIEPLDPVTPGHLLVIPRRHVSDFRADPRLLGGLMQVAADFAPRECDCNLIVSAGAEATQTVPHLHVHVVPRRQADGLCLPWWCASSQGAWPGV